MKLLRIACICFLLATAGFAGQSDKPKNIIILIGDGMGPADVSISVLKLQNDPFRRFTTVGFSVTCSADNLITDSAAGATVLSTGYRTNNSFIGVDTDKKPLKNIMEIAEGLGLSTGVVSTSSCTHATPAGFVAHEETRKNEREIAKDFTDIDIDVVIGGGLQFFTPPSAGGNRLDNLNLADTLKSRGYALFTDADDFLKAEHPGKFYALLEKESLPKACDRDYTLGQLASAAITNLSKNEKGFVLMVEGSQIDWGGHDNDEDRIVTEMKDFNTAINTALDFAEKDGNTLVLVIADHETGGVAITGGSRDAEDITLGFSTKQHTASMVGVFTKGPGEDQFRTIQDNFMIGRKLINFVDPAYKF